MVLPYPHAIRGFKQDMSSLVHSGLSVRLERAEGSLNDLTSRNQKSLLPPQDKHLRKYHTEYIGLDKMGEVSMHQARL